LDIYGRDDEKDILERILTGGRKETTTTVTETTTTATAKGDPCAVPPAEAPQHDSSQPRQQPHQQEQKRELVLISGPSGVGKSSLAYSVRSKVRKTGGAFIVGKFENATTTTEPFSAILDACSELCCQVLAASSSSSSSSSSSNIAQDNKISPASLNLNNDDLKDLLEIIPDFGVVVGAHASILSSSTASVSSSNTTTDTSLNDEDNDDNNNNIINKLKTKRTNGKGTSLLQESKHRFHYLLRKFFRIASSLLDGPVVLVLDDMQWADFASLDLLEILLTDNKRTIKNDNPSKNGPVAAVTTKTTTVSNFIVVGLYRSNDVSSTHMLRKLIRDMKHRAGTDVFGSSIVVTEIEIGNLHQEDILLLLVDLLGCADTSRLQSLASICHQKTAGNAFFLLQYLEQLHSKGLLEYSFGLGGWMWDEDRIKSETNATDNVVDLMKQKLSQLPPQTLTILQIAACLGSTFQQGSLFKVWQALQDTSEVADQTVFLDSISDAVDGGLLEKNDENSTYHWIHDSILEAVVALLSPDELKSLQFDIGNALIRQRDQSRREIILAVNLLNAGMIHSNLDETTKVELAKFNLMAAKNSTNLSAFDSASRYVTIGVSLLPKNHWTTHSKLALELHSLGAEVKGCLGNIAEMEYHCHVVIQQDLTLMDKLRVYHVLLECTANRHKLPEAIKLCLKVLKDLGCTFPKSAFSVNILTILGVLGFQSMFGSGTPVEKVDELTRMTDRRRIEVMRLLDKLATYCYISANQLFPLITLRRLNYTLKYGICDSSATDFACLGMILTGKLFDFQAGSTCARYSLALLERLNSNRVHSRTLFLSYGFVLPWTQPTQSCLRHIFQGHEIGM
jgi:predicted ATPase